MKAENIRVTITLNKQKAEAIQKKAASIGIPIATYLRIVVSEVADDIKKQAA